MSSLSMSCIDIAAEWLDLLSEHMDIGNIAILDDLHVQLLQNLQDQQPPKFNAS